MAKFSIQGVNMKVTDSSINFKMNPITEDLLSSGRQLTNGMIVLVEDHMSRMSKPKEDGSFSSEYEERRYMENNRWCRVQDLRREGDLVKFVAVYEDGHKCQRTYNRSYAWYVKIDAQGVPVIDFDFGTVPGVVDTEWTPMFRFIATYQMMGDLGGHEWANLVLEHAIQANDIKAYRILSSLTGAWGLKYVTFEFDAETPGIEKFDETVTDAGHAIAAKICCEQDVRVFGAELLNAL